MRKYINAIIIAMLLTSTVFAGQVTKKIEVLFNSVNIMVNGKKVVADNISYNGTTYVPLRTISTMLNKDVSWDGKTNTAQINNKDIQKQNPVATIIMTNGDKIRIELYPEVAPNTVNNFITLVNKGFYNGLNFHRAVPGFVIQGGDPEGNGMGGPGYSIQGEFMKNGVQNDILHTRGIISMARSADPDSAGSQFFIVVEDAHFLNGEYAAFGRVIQGMEVVDKIVNVTTDNNDQPLEPQIIKSMSVELFGKVYGKPEVIQ